MEAVAEKPKPAKERTPFFKITADFIRDAIEIYFVRRNKHTFFVPVLDAKGEALMIKEPATGRLFPDMQSFFFQQTAQRHQEGLLCFYKVTKETEKRVADALKNAHKRPGSELMDLEQYRKATNPDEYEALKEKEALKGQLEAVQKDAAALVDEILEAKDEDSFKALRKRLKKLKEG